jgi:CBS-domain-containing membrane protein
VQNRACMTPSVVTVRRDRNLTEVARPMLQHHNGSVPAANTQGKLSGIITVSDWAAKEQSISCSTVRTPQMLPCLLRTFQETKPCDT